MNIQASQNESMIPPSRDYQGEDEMVEEEEYYDEEDIEQVYYQE